MKLDRNYVTPYDAFKALGVDYSETSKRLEANGNVNGQRCHDRGYLD